MAEGELNVSACLIRGLTVIQMLQLPSGQVATFHQTEHPTDLQAEGQQALGPVALPSAQVHDALASFDPSVMGSNAATQAVVQAQRAWFCSSVRVVRRRLRGYLCAERQADGSWRCLGRGSGSVADLATTACASLALSEAATTGASAQRFSRRAAHLSQQFGGVGRDLQTSAYRLYLASLAGADTAGLRQQILDQLGALEPPQQLEAKIGLTVIRAWRLAGFADAELQACWPQGARSEGSSGLPQSAVDQSAEDRAAMACVGSQLADWPRVESLAPSLQADLFAAPNSAIAPGKAMSIAVRYAWAMLALGQWAAMSGRCRR